MRLCVYDVWRICMCGACERSCVRIHTHMYIHTHAQRYTYAQSQTHTYKSQIADVLGHVRDRQTSETDRQENEDMTDAPQTTEPSRDEIMKGTVIYIYIYIYIYMYVCMYVCMYIYIYIEPMRMAKGLRCSNTYSNVMILFECSKANCI